MSARNLRHLLVHQDSDFFAFSWHIVRRACVTYNCNPEYHEEVDCHCGWEWQRTANCFLIITKSWEASDFVSEMLHRLIRTSTWLVAWDLATVAAGITGPQSSLWRNIWALIYLWSRLCDSFSFWSNEISIVSLVIKIAFSLFLAKYLPAICQ